MDFPLSKATELRLVGGRYADRTTVPPVPGTIVSAEEFMNAVVDELKGLQTAAGVVATEGDNTQVGLAAQILARGGALGFEVKPRTPLSLSVDIGAGVFFSRASGLLVSVGATSVGPIVAPAGDPRNDIVFVDALTGAPGIETGAGGPVPVDPALPLNKLPLARITAYVGMTEIAAVDISGLRYLGTAGIAASSVVTEVHRNTADQIVNNSAVLVDATDLVAPLAVNERVAFKLTGFFTSGSTADFKFTFTVPAGAAIQWHCVQGLTLLTVFTSGDTKILGSTVGTPGGVTIQGVVTNGGLAGDLQFQFGQSGAQAVDTILREDSILTVMRGYS